MTTQLQTITNPLAEVLHLIDLEDDGENTVQAYSMRAAKALFDLKESPGWVEEMEARKAEQEAKTNRAVQWSPTSDRTFHLWLTEKIIETGRHRQMARSETRRLLFAEAMRREFVKVDPMGSTPPTERAWRPFTPFYVSGYTRQLVEAVQTAAKIAEDEGADRITHETATTAKWLIWKNDPEIQARGAHPDQASERDKAIKFRNQAETAVKNLWRTGQKDQMNGFELWIMDWLQNWQAVK